MLLLNVIKYLIFIDKAHIILNNLNLEIETDEKIFKNSHPFFVDNIPKNSKKSFYFVDDKETYI